MKFSRELILTSGIRDGQFKHPPAVITLCCIKKQTSQNQPSRLGFILIFSKSIVQSHPELIKTDQVRVKSAQNRTSLDNKSNKSLDKGYL